MVNFDMVKVW